MARIKSSTQDSATLQMALVGYELEKQKIEEKIKEIQSRLGVGGRRGVRASAAPKEAPKKRVLSAAARRRIALAQKRRWAEHRRRLAQAGKGA